MNFYKLVQWILGLLCYTIVVYVLYVQISWLRWESVGCCDPIQNVEDNKTLIKYYGILLIATIVVSTFLYLRTRSKFTLITVVFPVLITGLILVEVNHLNNNVMDFDSQVWQEKRPVKMAIDIEKNMDLMGKSSAEVIGMLGEPDKIKSGKHYKEFSYYTSYKGSIGHNNTTNIGCVTLYVTIRNDEVGSVLLNCAF
jgi:hypothetical protein